jgi:cobalt/nickel transport system permease protein
MASVLVAQSLLLGDGGIAALGANILNMALVPTAIVAIAGRTGATSPNQPVAMGGAAGLAVVLAAALIVAETAMFRPLTELTQWPAFAVRMVGYHLWIGAIEGVATGAMIGLALAPAWRKSLWTPAVGLVAIALVAILLSIASSLPDGYEAAAQASGIGQLLVR